jgi:CopG family transcriptional regulator, nickel-responsive regulator
MGAGTHRCVGAVIYVYDSSARELPQRLVELSRDRPELFHTTLHVHLDHDRCMEVMVLQGRAEEVRGLSDQLIAQQGVRHGRLILMPIDFKSKVNARKRMSEPRRPHR